MLDTLSVVEVEGAAGNVGGFVNGTYGSITVDADGSFTYLRAFASDREKLQELEEHYRKGGLGDGDVKKHLFEELEHFIAPIRKRRAEFAKDPGELMRMLKEGSQVAREKAGAVLSEVRAAMHLNY